MPKLVFVGKEFAGRVHDLTLEKTTVGRGLENGLVLGDKSVSERHAEILVNQLEVIVRDLGSTNGTYVGDLKVVKQQPVKAGQQIRFGSVEARLEFSQTELADEADTASDMTAIHAHKRYVNAPQPPPPLLHDEVFPESGPPNSTAHTLILPKGLQPTPSPIAPPPPPPKADRRWLWIGSVVVLLFAAAAALVWWFTRR